MFRRYRFTTTIFDYTYDSSARVNRMTDVQFRILAQRKKAQPNSTAV
ncbi:hypothetical protein DOY81_003207, partial [Sarcophaga bullata]